MLNTFYLFLAPTLFIIGFLTFKYLRHKEEILAISEVIQGLLQLDSQARDQ
jgi:hypothetical protein